MHNPIRLATVSLMKTETMLKKQGENFLLAHNEEGYNLLQKCVGLNNVEVVRWILTRNVDINRGACSLPLHIACLKGYEDVVELLLKHGGRIDVEARMCWPGPHNQNCEERFKNQASLFNTRVRQLWDVSDIDGLLCFFCSFSSINRLCKVLSYELLTCHITLFGVKVDVELLT